MNVIVDRKTWYRGKGSAASKLLSDDGRCCLGFAAAQCGIPDARLLNVDTPARLARRNQDDAKALPANFFETFRPLEDAMNTTWIGDAMNINDNHQIPDSLRETKLVALFAENGHTITFEG